MGATSRVQSTRTGIQTWSCGSLEWQQGCNVWRRPRWRNGWCQLFQGDFIVLGWNTTKQSVKLGAQNGKKIVIVGNVTIPDKYVEQIKPNAVVRVRYLYATPAKKLYQPTLDPTDDGSVVRTDIKLTINSHGPLDRMLETYYRLSGDAF